MARVLDRFTAPRARIDSVRNHGVEEFHGISLEEFDKAEFLAGEIQRALDEVKCPPKQMAKCVVSLLQDAAYHGTSLSKNFRQSTSLMITKRPSGSYS